MSAEVVAYHVGLGVKYSDAIEQNERKEGTGRERKGTPVITGLQSRQMRLFQCKYLAP